MSGNGNDIALGGRASARGRRRGGRGRGRGRGDAPAADSLVVGIIGDKEGERGLHLAAPETPPHPKRRRRNAPGTGASTAGTGASTAGAGASTAGTGASTAGASSSSAGAAAGDAPLPDAAQAVTTTSACTSYQAPLDDKPAPVLSRPPLVSNPPPATSRGGSIPNPGRAPRSRRRRPVREPRIKRTVNYGSDDDSDVENFSFNFSSRVFVPRAYRYLFEDSEDDDCL